MEEDGAGRAFRGARCEAAFGDYLTRRPGPCPRSGAEGRPVTPSLLAPEEARYGDRLRIYRRLIRTSGRRSQAVALVRCPTGRQRNLRVISPRATATKRPGERSRREERWLLSRRGTRKSHSLLCCGDQSSGASCGATSGGGRLTPVRRQRRGRRSRALRERSRTTSLISIADLVGRASGAAARSRLIVGRQTSSTAGAAAIRHSALAVFRRRARRGEDLPCSSSGRSPMIWPLLRLGRHFVLGHRIGPLESSHRLVRAALGNE